VFSYPASQSLASTFSQGQAPTWPGDRRTRRRVPGQGAAPVWAGEGPAPIRRLPALL